MDKARIRGMVLQLFYARADDAFHRPRPDDFPCTRLGFEEIFSACELLDEYGLLEWKSIRRQGGSSAFGCGRITQQGMKVVEREIPSVLDIELPCRQAVDAETSRPLPLPRESDIGHHIRQIRQAIETCNDNEVGEARRQLHALLSHPRLSQSSHG